jgi:hypothetical protein
MLRLWSVIPLRLVKAVVVPFFSQGGRRQTVQTTAILLSAWCTKRSWNLSCMRGGTCDTALHIQSDDIIIGGRVTFKPLSLSLSHRQQRFTSSQLGI